MEFIKRHYEKLILLALSVVSFFAVWHMSGVVNKTQDVRPEDLEIRIPKDADQVSLAQKSGEYDAINKGLNDSKTTAEEKQKLRENRKRLGGDKDFVDYYFTTNKYGSATMIAKERLVWNRTAAHSAARENYHTDLVEIFPMAICPHCNYGVPLYCFRKHEDGSGNKCIICGELLKDPPQKIKKRRRLSPDDSDGDGITNDNENRYGLNSKDPGDALLDYDGDGFSNLYEINVSNTDPRNPTSCPPLWRRLRYRGLAKIKLPIQISGIDVNSPDRKKWEASIKLEVRDPKTGRLRKREQDCKIGDTLNFDGLKYEVTNIERQKEKDDRGIERNKDTVTLVTRDDKGKVQHELKLVFGQPVYSPDFRVVLEDIGVPEDSGIPDDPNLSKVEQVKRFYAVRSGKKKAIFELRVGEKFEMGGVSDSGSARNVPKEIYVLKSFDEKAKVAQLSRVKTRNSGEEDLDKDRENVLMEVTVDSYIVEDEWVAMPSSDRPTGEKEQNNAPGRRR